MGFFSRLFGLDKKEDNKTKESSESLEQLSQELNKQTLETQTDDAPIADEIQEHEQGSVQEDNEAVFSSEQDLKEQNLSNEIVDHIATQVEEAEKKEPSCDSNKQETIAKPLASEEHSSPTVASAIPEQQPTEVKPAETPALDSFSSFSEAMRSEVTSKAIATANAQIQTQGEEYPFGQKSVFTEEDNLEFIVNQVEKRAQAKEQDAVKVELEKAKQKESKQDTEISSQVEVTQELKEESVQVQETLAHKTTKEIDQNQSQEAPQEQDLSDSSNINEEDSTSLSDVESEVKVETKIEEKEEEESESLLVSWFKRSPKKKTVPQQTIQEAKELKEEETKEATDTQDLNQEDTSQAEVKPEIAVNEVSEQVEAPEPLPQESKIASKDDTNELSKKRKKGKKAKTEDTSSEPEVQVSEEASSEEVATQETDQPVDDESVESVIPSEAESTEESQVEVVNTAEEEVKAAKVEKESFFARLKRTRDNLAFGVSSLIKGRKIDDDLYEDLETALLTADLGVETTQFIIERLQNESRLRDLHDAGALRKNLKNTLCEILEPCAQPLVVTEHSPFVILMVGVNGAGKTTTIGKLARKFQDQGLSVMLAAGDTFRAAAVEQLKEWGKRSNVPVVAQDTGSDSASVLFDALKSAKARNIDVLLCDTAGRLQNKDNLMEELKKIVRVLKKIDDNVPHETLLVLDAATGQNAISQTKIFTSAVNVSGLVLTKLDGTAKGGVVFNLAQQFKIPIRYVGIGEKVEDLREFKIEPFVDALVEDTKD